MGYADNVKMSREYKAANQDAGIKNVRFRAQYKNLKKFADGIVKYGKKSYSASEGNWFHETAKQNIKGFQDEYKNLTGWLSAKTRSISYGSMYDQQEGRGVYHKDKKWAELKLAKVKDLELKTKKSLAKINDKTYPYEGMQL